MWAARLVTDRDDRIDCVSDPVSEVTVDDRGINLIGVRGGDVVLPKLSDGSRGLGTYMVLRTSRASLRPRTLRDTVFC